jgi:hypothetical protein
MANQITGAEIQQAQNTAENLRLLAAQRQLYLDEKFLFGLQAFLALLNAVLGALIALSSTLTLYVLFAGFVISFVNEAIGFLMGNKQKQAARIQEQFDCSVLKLPWHKLTAGDAEPPENIEAAARRFQLKQKNPLRDWYIGTLEKLRFDAARVLCQRTNCAYDIALREKYLSGLAQVFMASVIAVCFIGFFGAMSVQDWALKLVGPLLPGFFLFMRQRQAHLDSIGRLRELRAHADGIWMLIIDGKSSSKRLNDESRSLQNAIFNHRSKSVVQFEWIYNRFRGQLEKEQSASNDTLIEQYLKAANT